MLLRITPDWNSEPCIVAAPGPSLTAEVVEQVRMKRWHDHWRVIAVQDAYRVTPWAHALYGCNPSWWRVHRDCGGFEGEKWSTHEGEAGSHLNDKREAADKWRVKLVRGADGEGFSLNPAVIHYGSNSGFQAINLAILKGCTRIVLVGFDMRRVEGEAHFFGEHPDELRRDTDYSAFIPSFERAAKLLPPNVQIFNATPGSALRCFPSVHLSRLNSRDWPLAAGSPKGELAVAV